jgi:membrane protease subunit (stomatin/prohibitin family)
MRARPKTSVLTRRPARRRHDEPREAAPAAPEDDHPQERRARESGGPIDRACYTCGCGMVFDAPVSTTVSCPHCGDPQAW